MDDSGPDPWGLQEHEGPWTAADRLALASRLHAQRRGRVELVDGSLLVGPATGAARTAVVERVRQAVAAALPSGLRVTGPVALRLGPDCVLVPDLIVTRTPAPGPGAATPGGGSPHGGADTGRAPVAAGTAAELPTAPVEPSVTARGPVTAPFSVAVMVGLGAGPVDVPVSSARAAGGAPTGAWPAVVAAPLPPADPHVGGDRSVDPVPVPAPEGPELLDAADVLMVVEVVGREHGAADRLFKPQLYARGRIPYSLLVDHDAALVVAGMIINGRYHEYARAADGAPLVLEEPFPLRLHPVEPT